MTERVSSSVSSSETVVATPIAASTAMPRLSPPLRPATVSPVMMLIIGSTASSRHRNGSATASRASSGLTARFMSMSTGRSPISSVRWWRIAP